jgi:uncharacterized protein YfbU (UPF0304 family)
MKIVTNNAVYVQKDDMIALNETDLPIPTSIFNKVWGIGITIIDGSNRYEFIKFEEEHEIEYFKELDWIVDYNELKDLDEAGFIALGEKAAQEQQDIAEKYNFMTKEEQNKNQDLVSRHQMLTFKIYSIRDVLWFKQGHIRFELPEGVEYPKWDEEKEQKGFQKLLSKFKINNNSKN